VSAANGRIDDAEQELIAALRELTEAGQKARCVHPAARLAEIRVLQGRFEEAEQLLAGFEDEPESLQAAVGLKLARGEAAVAAALLERRLAQVGSSSMLAVPLLGRLVEARLAAGEIELARSAADRLSELAANGGRERAEAAASLARGRVLAAAGESGAAAALEAALDAFTMRGLALDAARVRLELARALAGSNDELAIDLARRARRELDGMGAAREADAAAALLRELGVKGRTGPRTHEGLSKRELEVLRLLGEGLTNAEIAARLFISPKTAEHHTSRIYAKVGLAGRAEAAAYAARNLGPE
jgi:DNA-binding CsgD family transcriptional regulator